MGMDTMIKMAMMATTMSISTKVKPPFLLSLALSLSFRVFILNLPFLGWVWQAKGHRPCIQGVSVHRLPTGRRQG